MCIYHLYKKFLRIKFNNVWKAHSTVLDTKLAFKTWAVREGGGGKRLPMSLSLLWARALECAPFLPFKHLPSTCVGSPPANQRDIGSPQQLADLEFSQHLLTHLDSKYLKVIIVSSKQKPRDLTLQLILKLNNIHIILVTEKDKYTNTALDNLKLICSGFL